MTSRALFGILILLLCTTHVGCGGTEDEAIGTDQDSAIVRIVVQETNKEAVETFSNPCAEDEITHERETVRTCDDQTVRVVMCNTAQWCDAILDAAAARVASCENMDGDTLTLDVDCAQ